MVCFSQGEIRMLGRTIKYFRLKSRKNRRELAMAAGLTEYVIKSYESGKRLPVLSEIRNIASALNVNLSWLMSSYNHYEYRHGEFCKHSHLNKYSRDYIRLSVEDYLDRFLTVADILGNDVMRKVPEVHSILPSGDVESDASKLRDLLRLAPAGAISNLVSSLEDNGILIYLLECEDDKFSGMNGLVCNRPYIVLNSMATPECQRSTLAHELVYIFFSLPEDDNSEWEKYMMAVSGAFLFPASYVSYELGNKRQIKMEEPTLFTRYVLRAVREEKISSSKGAELLRMPYYDFR